MPCAHALLDCLLCFCRGGVHHCTLPLVRLFAAPCVLLCRVLLCLTRVSCHPSATSHECIVPLLHCILPWATSPLNVAFYCTAFCHGHLLPSTLHSTTDVLLRPGCNIFWCSADLLPHVMLCCLTSGSSVACCTARSLLQHCLLRCRPVS